MRYLSILGQNPELSLAELEAVYPNIKITASVGGTAVFESAEKIDIGRLGGTPKLAEILGEGEASKIILEELAKLPKNQKIFFGVSFYGNARDKKLGIKIKEKLKSAGYKARLVTSKEPALSSVVVKTNKLLTRGGDFCVLGGLVAKTVAVQDFADYERRDIGRPARDLYSGMTPPKLAKILINLLNLSPSSEGEIREGVRPEKKSFLDPFCGSGTFLMEAALLGFQKICGSDVSGRAVNDSAKNLNWLKEKYGLTSETDVKQCDVTDLKKCWAKRFDCIATEPYLGPPIRGKLDFQKAENLRKELNTNYEKYLPALSGALEKNGALILIVPFLITDKGELKITLKIKENGLVAVREPIKYSRPDQKIGREIYILRKM